RPSAPRRLRRRWSPRSATHDSCLIGLCARSGHGTACLHGVDILRPVSQLGHDFAGVLAYFDGETTQFGYLAVVPIGMVHESDLAASHFNVAERLAVGDLRIGSQIVVGVNRGIPYIVRIES